MHVDTKTNGVLVKVVNRVKVLQESVSNKEEVLVLSGQAAFVDNEVTLLMAGLIKVLLGINLKNVITHLEPNWLHLRSDILTALLHMAECLV